MSASNSTVSYRDLSTIGFPGYRIGDDGGLWSCIERVWVKGVRGCRSIIGSEWVPMAGNPHIGYLRATLSRNGKTKREFVHRLVLRAFIGEPPKGLQACHNNGDKMDNRLSNLRWDTAKANVADMIRNGEASGIYFRDVKLTPEDVISIRSRYRNGDISMYALADEYNLNPRTIFSAIHGVNWKSVA